tara:strand:+ start:1245 stop:1511 length:267 start_codon:yes stop_codon:yes gene_type:complete
MIVKTKKKLPQDLIKYIMAFVEPTSDQLEEWKMEHFLIGWYKVMEDIKDLTIVVDFNNKGEKYEYFTLFSWDYYTLFDWDGNLDYFDE